VAEVAPSGLHEGEESLGGPKLEGVVSAWYPGEGLIGSNYGFIERQIPSARGIGLMEHHRFEGEDVVGAGRGKLRKGVRVRFATAGRDTTGRWRAVKVAPLGAGASSSPASDAVSSRPVADLLGGGQGSKASSGGAIFTAPAGSVQAITKELVLKAWAKLGGEATSSEIVAKIKKDKKLSARVASELSTARQDSGDEVWEELIPKIMKEEGEWTKEKRVSEGSDKPAKIWRLRDLATEA